MDKFRSAHGVWARVCFMPIRGGMHNTTIARRIMITIGIILMVPALLFSMAHVEKEAKAVQRIVSLSPNVTETIYALGKGELLVGRSDYCTYPEEALALPSVGTLYTPSLEKLLALEPTMVISSAFASDQFLGAVEKAGIEVLQLSTQESFNATYELIRQISEAVNAKEQAELMILSMQNMVREVALKALAGSRPTVYMALDFGSFDSAATADTFLSEMIEMAGGNNVAKDGKNWTYSKEMLLFHDPQVILLSPRWGESAEETAREFTTTKPYSDLSGAIRTFDADMVSRQGPRSALSLKLLYDLIHLGEAQ